MHPWHQRDLARRLREIAKTVEDEAVKIEERKPEELRWAVCWGPSGIQFQDRTITSDETRDMAANAIWALFESIRDGGNPGDPVAFADVIASVTAAASKRCHQRPTAPAKGPA